METDSTQHKKDASDDGDGQTTIANRVIEISPPNAAAASSNVVEAPPQIHPRKARSAARKAWKVGWLFVKRGWRWVTTERINAASTAIIAIFTVAMVGVGILQWLDLRKSTEAAQTAAKAAAASVELIKQGAKTANDTASALQKTAEANAKSAAASENALEWYKKQSDNGERSANATKESANTLAAGYYQTEKFDQLAMRAFLFAIDTKLEATKSPRQILATLLIKNTGQTPAQHVSLRSVMECIPINTDPKIFLTPQEIAKKPLEYEVPLQYRPLSTLPLSPTARLLLQQGLQDKSSDGSPKAAPLQSEIITAAPESVGPSGQFQVSIPISVPDDSQWKAWNPTDKPAQLVAWVTGLLLYEDYFGTKRYTRFTYKETKNLKTGGLDLGLAEFANDLN